MKFKITNSFELRISYLFLLILLVLSFVPVQHKVHCKPLLFIEECPVESVFLGKLVMTHSFMVFYQIFTLELSFLFSETLSVLLFFLIFFVVGNFVVNLFLRKLSLSLSSDNFLKKSININFKLIPDKTFLINFSLFLFSVVFFMLVLEVLSRTLSSTTDNACDNSMFVADNNLGWINKPSYLCKRTGENSYDITLKHNSLGLRSETELGSKTKKRILLIGDSFIYGAGLDVNETFDHFLTEQIGDDFEVVNGGVVGYSTLQYFINLKHLYDKVKPDVVLIGVYSNDFKENIFPELGWLSVFNKPAVIIPEINVYSLLEKGNEKSYELLSKGSSVFFWFNQKVQTVKDSLSKYSEFYKWMYSKKFNFLGLKEEGYGSRYYVFSTKENNLLKKEFEIECSLLEKTSSFLKENNIPHLFFYIPVRFEIEQWRTNPTFNIYYDISAKDIDMDRPLNELKSCAERKNIDFFSLKDKFLDAGDELYNKNDNHWSTKATNITAQLLKEELVKRGMIS